MDENEMNVLDELNKGSCMGMDAIHFVLDKVEDENLKEVLNNQYKNYEDISNQIGKLYPKYSDKEPHETNTMNKVLTWYGVEMKTLMDNSSSKIAELLLQGTNMGIIEGRKILNNKKLDSKVHKIAQEYVARQEDAVEKLKKFL